MKILNYCRHKKAGWEGVIFEDDFGKRQVTNGIAIWETTEKRLSQLELVNTINVGAFHDNMKSFNPQCPLMDVLNASTSRHQSN